MRVSLYDLVLRFLAGPPLPQPPLGDPGNQAGTFLSPPVRQSCNSKKQAQNIADCEQTETKHSISRQHMETAPTPSPPNYRTDILPLFRKILGIFRGISKDVFIHLSFLIYSLTMVCACLGFHGALVGKHCCTLQESYTYAISVAVQQEVSDIKMHTLKM